MKIKALFPTALLILIARAQAQVAGRSFVYTSMDTMTCADTAVGPIAVAAQTKVTVHPYLYISGDVGASWVVRGWGKGDDTTTNALKFYHNETLTLSCSNFANLVKMSGTQTGAQAVLLSGEFHLFNDSTGADLGDSGMVPIAILNSAYTSSGPNFPVSATGGILRLTFSRQISIDPTVGPGTYENFGTITVIRN